MARLLACLICALVATASAFPGASFLQRGSIHARSLIEGPGLAPAPAPAMAPGMAAGSDGGVGSAGAPGTPAQAPGPAAGPSSDPFATYDDTLQQAVAPAPASGSQASPSPNPDSALAPTSDLAGSSPKATPAATPAAVYSTAATIPVVKLKVSLTAATVADFAPGSTLRNQFIQGIVDALAVSGSRVGVNITSVTSGSINVDSSVYFLDGSSSGAQDFASKVTTSSYQAALFPSTTFGAVTVATPTITTVDNPNAAPAPPPSGKTTNKGAIAGGVIGGVVFVALVAGAAVFLIKRRKIKPRANQSLGDRQLGISASWQPSSSHLTLRSAPSSLTSTTGHRVPRVPERRQRMSTVAGLNKPADGGAGQAGLRRALDIQDGKFMLSFNHSAGDREREAQASQPRGPLAKVFSFFRLEPLDSEDKKKVLCEFVTQACFNFMSCGAVAMAKMYAGGNTPLLMGFIMAAHLVLIPVMIYTAGPVSGAHFNPMVTATFMATRLMKVSTGIGYIIAQCLGGVAGAAAAFYSLPSALQVVGFAGVQGVPVDRTVLQAFLGEVYASFFFLFVLFGMVVDKRGWGKLGPLAVPLAIVLDMWIVGPVSSMCINPARAFGPAFVTGYWDHHWIWWTAPFIGGITAGKMYASLFLPKDQRPKASAGPPAGGAPLAVGQLAPDLRLAQWIKGLPQRERLMHNILVLDFFSPSHKLSRATVPYVSALSRRYRTADVNFIGIGSGELQEVEKFLRQVDSHYPSAAAIYHSIALDAECGTAAAYAGLFGEDKGPTSVVINREGRIVWAGSPVSSGLEAAIKQELALPSLAGGPLQQAEPSPVF
ncbi:hypothetical protein WJX72_009249 [[Myrmecia] bisecta]|uniref:Thioredoxin domain-containing protein n=1 Tax=[Myrmecia] bisecta TaxID=41462 RepID=A0AAW1Q4I3_9CHLO